MSLNWLLLVLAVLLRVVEELLVGNHQPELLRTYNNLVWFVESSKLVSSLVYNLCNNLLCRFHCMLCLWLKKIKERKWLKKCIEKIFPKQCNQRWNFFSVQTKFLNSSSVNSFKLEFLNN